VVVETVFNWNGIGFLAVTAIKNNDFFLTQAIVIVVAVLVVIVSILIDISYKVIDPRVKLT
jgi:peptide/nickel transport system permease protein